MVAPSAPEATTPAKTPAPEANAPKKDPVAAPSAPVAAPPVTAPAPIEAPKPAPVVAPVVAPIPKPVAPVATAAPCTPTYVNPCNRDIFDTIDDQLKNAGMMYGISSYV